jgi:hypothetical protein
VKRLFVSQQRTGIWCRRGWLLAVKLVGTILLLGLYVLSNNASGDSPAEAGAPASLVLTDPASSAGTAAPPVPVESMPAQGSGIEATHVSTYTVFLPKVFSDYWHVAESPFGIQIYQVEPLYPQRIDHSGARWIRIRLMWVQIERRNTAPDDYQWPASLDEGLAELSARNIRIILTLSHNPSWAATYPGGPIDRVDLDELVEFMTAAVAHYSVPPYNVKYWEFYNEPDCGHELCGEFGFSYWGHQPDAYAEMLAAVYQPMKAVDPEAQIVLGGLAYDWWIESGGPFVEGFLDGVLQNGGGDFFDVMNFHYYPAYHARWDRYGMGIIGKTAYLREKLAEYGVSKPFICTEAGMRSDEAHGSSHELQSRYVVQVFVRSKAADLDTTIWFMIVDEEGPGTSKWGLLTPDLGPKPAYVAYQVLARQLALTEYVRTLDPAETGSEQIEAYEFVSTDDATRIVVAWTNDEHAYAMTLPVNELLMVTKYGEKVTIRDGDDGVVDGYVTVVVGPSPLYLRLSP